ncbi:hypothetical protein CTheo_1505 [Ceratobasidium theobromae]|uniref:Uncharacterized protein n=1 Tax=Ceratobasidium theobromae TaxID=1582974 RepID=A0A5N5QTN3_9AGAM|nr:hypothetical protein CTheo_1505 [Ceratobasidium theobromae]
MVTNSDFNRRQGSYRFYAPSGPMHTWTSMVHEWADRARVSLEWSRSQTGPSNALTYYQTPIIDGVLHPEYQGYGSTSQGAKNMACEKIARSGHCVSDSPARATHN